MYTQQYDPATPLETLLGANIAFRGLRDEYSRKFPPVILFTYVVYSTTIPQPP